MSFADEYRAVVDGGPWPGIERAFNHTGGVVPVSERARWTQRMLRSFAEDYTANPQACLVVAYTNKRVDDFNRLIRPVVLGPEADMAAYLEGETLLANDSILEEPPAEGGEPDILLTNGSLTQVVKAEAGSNRDVQGHWVTVETATGDRRVFVARQLADVKARLAQLAKDAREGRIDWEQFYTAKASFADLRPPFACTAHKAQGRTVDVLYADSVCRSRQFFPLKDQPEELARALYVVCTRPRQWLCTTGQPPRAERVDPRQKPVGLFDWANSPRQIRGPGQCRY